MPRFVVSEAPPARRAASCLLLLLFLPLAALLPGALGAQEPAPACPLAPPARCRAGPGRRCPRRQGPVA